MNEKITKEYLPWFSKLLGEEEGVEANNSGGIILKMIASKSYDEEKDVIKPINLFELLEETYEIREKTGISLYSYELDYLGRLNSREFWRDIFSLRAVGDIEFVTSNPFVKITLEGIAKAKKTLYPLDIREEFQKLGYR